MIQLGDVVALKRNKTDKGIVKTIRHMPVSGNTIIVVRWDRQAHSGHYLQAHSGHYLEELTVLNKYRWRKL